MLSVLKLGPNSVGIVHIHPEEQWGFLLEGECVRIQGDEEMPMKAGDFCSTPGVVTHGIRISESGSMVLDIFNPQREEYKDH